MEVRNMGETTKALFRTKEGREEEQRLWRRRTKGLIGLTVLTQVPFLLSSFAGFAENYEFGPHFPLVQLVSDILLGFVFAILYPVFYVIMDGTIGRRLLFYKNFIGSVFCCRPLPKLLDYQDDYVF